MEIGENKSSHVRKISTYKPQVLLLSSIKENPNSSSIDSEIGVFGAEKYFSMKLEHHNTSTLNTTTKPIKKQNKDNPQQQHNPTFTKTTSSRSKSSVKSESSYNSQTFLMKINNENKQRKTNEVSISFGGFKCDGPCSGGKSVNTNRKIPGKSTKSNQDYVAYDARKRLQGLKKSDSLEGKNIKEVVSLPTKRSDIAINLERKLSMLTWDAIPNAQNAANYFSNKKRNSSSKMMQENEETASDTSSDLFEIENIITNCSSVYEPSEASIGWSVVTESVISDIDVKRVTRLRNKPAVKTVNGEKNRSSGGFLMGCKSNKAVLIVDSTKRSNDVKDEEEKEVMSHQKKFRRIQDLSFL